jgi:hypothetical protein
MRMSTPAAVCLASNLTCLDALSPSTAAILMLAAIADTSSCCCCCCLLFSPGQFPL